MELKRHHELLVAAAALFSCLSLGSCSTSPVPSNAPDVSAAEYVVMLDGVMPPDRHVWILSHSDKLFPTAVVERGNWVRTLPSARRQLGNVTFTSAGKTYDLIDYLFLNRVAALLVLKNGQVAFEDYELGTNAQTRWSSYSVAKSVSATLVGAALKDGSIRSVEDDITAYLPAMIGTAYEGVTVRNLLQMTSGVAWNERYSDPSSDQRVLGEAWRRGEAGSIVRYMGGLSRVAAPGARFNYNTGETYLLGAVLQGATGKRLEQYLSEKVWQPAGMESSATWWLESPGGIPLAGAGLSATLRDYGRFGLFVLENGNTNGRHILPDDWLAEAGSPKVVSGKTVDYGYMWWPVVAPDDVHRGAFRAQGLFGQFIYLNPAENLVIVVLCSRPKPPGLRGVIDDNAFFGAVAKALRAG